MWSTLLPDPVLVLLICEVVEITCFENLNERDIVTYPLVRQYLFLMVIPMPHVREQDDHLPQVLHPTVAPLPSPLPCEFKPGSHQCPIATFFFFEHTHKNNRKSFIFYGKYSKCKDPLSLAHNFSNHFFLRKLHQN